MRQRRSAQLNCVKSVRNSMTLFQHTARKRTKYTNNILRVQLFRPQKLVTEAVARGVNNIISFQH